MRRTVGSAAARDGSVHDTRAGRYYTPDGSVGRESCIEKTIFTKRTQLKNA
jgi:hypothetical protein